MLGGILRHLPEIGEDTGGQQVGADKVRRTVAGALLVAAADVTVLLAVLVLIPLLVHHMAAVGAEQHTGEQPPLHHSGSGVCAACVTPARAPMFPGL